MASIRTFWLIATSLLVSLGFAQSFNGLEIDVAFPRNETYDTSDIFFMPIVFNVHDPQNLTRHLVPEIEWSIYKLNESAGNYSFTADTFNPKFNSTQTTVYSWGTVDVDYLRNFGHFGLSWRVVVYNCSAKDHYSGTEYNLLEFTTGPDGIHPNITGEKCDGLPGMGITVATGSSTACPHVLPAITPAPDPCVGAKGLAAAASSISSVESALACAYPTPVISCPAPSGGTVQKGGHLQVALLLSVFLGLELML